MKRLIIAEIGINHDGNPHTASVLIEDAKEVGADIVKFQLYDVDTLFPDKQILAQGKNWYEEVKKTQLSKEEIVGISNYCKEIGIEFMASAFDLERLAWLEECGVKRHKVASRMNQNRPLIDAMVATGKQVIMSCSTKFTPSAVYPTIDFLYCVPKYPTEIQDLHLDDVMFDSHSHYLGFSDHTVGTEACVYALAHGARIIEKHFTYNSGSEHGPDHICSIDFDGMKELVRYARKFEKI